MLLNVSLFFFLSQLSASFYLYKPWNANYELHNGDTFIFTFGRSDYWIDFFKKETNNEKTVMSKTNQSIFTEILFYMLVPCFLDGQKVKQQQMASIGSSLRKSLLIAMFIYFIVCFIFLECWSIWKYVEICGVFKWQIARSFELMLKKFPQKI